MEKEAGSAARLSEFVILSAGGERRSRWKVWRSRATTILTVMAVLAATLLVGMRAAGVNAYAVLSGSMAPTLPVGSLIYVKPVDYKSLKVGDVISYVADTNKTVVTHRIAEIEVDETDAEVWRFRTKGDANNNTDGKLVHYKNIVGTPIATIPFLGYVVMFAQRPPGIYMMVLGGVMLVAWIFWPETSKERRKTARKQEQAI